MEVNVAMKIAPYRQLRMQDGPEHGHLVTNFGDPPYTYTFKSKADPARVEVYVSTHRSVGGEEIYAYAGTM